MPEYGTPDELAKWIDPDSESPAAIPLATVLLRAASQSVLDATAAAVYRTGSDGKAIDPAKLKALTEATLEQAQALHFAKIDPRRGLEAAARVVQSKGLEGASVTYKADAKRDTYLTNLADGKLAGSALTILRNAGLLSNRVQTRDRGNVPNIDAIPYDITTGRAIR